MHPIFRTHAFSEAARALSNALDAFLADYADELGGADSQDALSLGNAFNIAQEYHMSSAPRCGACGDSPESIAQRDRMPLAEVLHMLARNGEEYLAEGDYLCMGCAGRAEADAEFAQMERARAAEFEAHAVAHVL